MWVLKKLKRYVCAVFCIFSMISATSSEPPLQDIVQLSYAGSGSHLMNLYLSKLLDTNVLVIDSHTIRPLVNFNAKFGLSHNPEVPTYYRTHFIDKVDSSAFLIVLLRDYKEFFFH
jgi:hypothetical protein